MSMGNVLIALTILYNKNQNVNPSFNTFVTDCTNSLQRHINNTEKKFLKRAYQINTVSGIPFCFYDFKGIMKDNYFRQIIHKLEPIIIRRQKGKPVYFQLKGLYLDEPLTEKYTAMPINQRIFANFETMLSMVKHEPPAIHGIRIEATTSGLYDKLILLGRKPNSHNKTITLHYEELTLNIDTKVNVHSTGTVVIILGCTFHPIDYSDDGFITLLAHLGSVGTILGVECHNNFKIEPVINWRFKMFDFNKDSVFYDFPTNDYTVHAVFNHVRIYNKKMDKGSTVLRFEKQIRPNTTMSEELHKSEFRRASELIDLT